MKLNFFSSRKSLSIVTSILLAVALLFVSFEPVQAGSITNWELVYDHDANGNTISGSFANLVSAIRSGADVQVVQHGPLADVLIKAQHVRVEPVANPTLVIAFLSDFQTNTERTDVFRRLMVYKTNGVREITLQQNSGISNSTDNIAMSWYVNR